MWAVVKIAGKQYKIQEGDIVEVGRIKAESPVSFRDVLLLSNGDSIKIGTPFIEGAEAQAEIVNETKEKKVTVFKYKRRKSYRRKQGHRQIKTRIKILKIKST